MDPQLVAGIAGPLIGIVGGAAGTYCSIVSTRGPRERAYVVRAAVACWVLVITFVAALLLTPEPFKYWLWLPYAVVLSLGIVAGNRRQAQIRDEESNGVQ